MLILAINGGQEEAEICLLRDYELLTKESWSAGRQLSRDIFAKIEKLLQECNQVWSDLDGVICCAGPGSFTGLRIGHAVANALAYSLDIPVANAEGEDWAQKAIDHIRTDNSNRVIVPRYGRPARITRPRK